MQGYVGKDINEAILDYGPPSNIVELGDGKRAYQLIQNQTAMYSTGNAYAYGSGNTANAFGTAVTSGSESRCVYTLIAKQNKAGNWIVESFRKPDLMCE